MTPKTSLIVPGLLATGLAFARLPAAVAEPSAELLVVHGIPGADVGMPDTPRLPVDVLVDGTACLLKGLTFGSIAGPATLAAGTHRLSVSLADPDAPCTRPAIITAQVTLGAGSYSAVVAALSPANAPRADLFPVQNMPIQAGVVQYLNANASNARVTFLVSDTLGLDYALPLPPGQFDDTKSFGPTDGYSVSLFSRGRRFGPFPFRQVPQGEALLFAVGSARSGTLTVLIKELGFP